MDAVVLVQARMESSRLFGKVIMPLKGKPLIIRLLERLSVLPVKKVICAISDDPQSGPLREVLDSYQYDYYAGDPLNVFKRFNDTIDEKKLTAEVLVRVTADNPLTNTNAILKGIESLTSQNLDYLWIENCPVGMGCDIFNLKRFKEIAAEELTLIEQEHIIPAFQNRDYLNGGFVKTGFSTAAKKLSFTVDTVEQYLDLEKIYQKYYSREGTIDIDQLVLDAINKIL